MWSAAVGLDAWADKLEADPEWAGAKVTQEQVDDLLPIFERVRSAGLDADERQESRTPASPTRRSPSSRPS